MKRSRKPWSKATAITQIGVPGSIRAKWLQQRMVRNSTPGIPGSNERPAKRRGPGRCPESLHRRLAATANKELFSYGGRPTLRAQLGKVEFDQAMRVALLVSSELSVNECTARTNECISGTSTLEVSSTKRGPQASGLGSFRINRPAPGTISRRR